MKNDPNLKESVALSFLINLQKIERLFRDVLWCVTHVPGIKLPQLNLSPTSHSVAWQVTFRVHRSKHPSITCEFVNYLKAQLASVSTGNTDP